MRPFLLMCVCATALALVACRAESDESRDTGPENGSTSSPSTESSSAEDDEEVVAASGDTSERPRVVFYTISEA